MLWPPFLTLSASPVMTAYERGAGQGRARQGTGAVASPRSRVVSKPRNPLRKQWSGWGARVIITAGRQAAGRRRDGRAQARGRSNYDICGSLLAINSARNVVLIPPPRTQTPQAAIELTGATNLHCSAASDRGHHYGSEGGIRRRRFHRRTARRGPGSAGGPGACGAGPSRLESTYPRLPPASTQGKPARRMCCGKSFQ